MANNGKIDLLKIIASMAVIVIGLALMWLFGERENQSSIFTSIGVSLLASGFVILLQTILVERKHVNHAEEWGVEQVYQMRSEINPECDAALLAVHDRLDIVAFGLKSFRDARAKGINNLLEAGVKVRILTMNPDGHQGFLAQREKEEGAEEGSIQKSIRDLVKWANGLNKKHGASGGRIEVRGYKCMTLDFYWRMDDIMYIGPYWHKRGSQQTVTYKLKGKKKAFNLYADYFEDLWKDETNTALLTSDL